MVIKINKGKEKLLCLQEQPSIVEYSSILELFVKAPLFLVLSFPLNSNYLRSQTCAVWNTFARMV